LTEYPVAGATLAYENSGHALGFDKHSQNSYYANGNGCQLCHTSEGFLEYVTYGELVSEYIANPSQPGCFTCHSPHETGDFSLTTVKPVTLQEGSVFDVGSGNLCANCHHPRPADIPEVGGPDMEITNKRYGPHHGPQAALLAGVGGYKVPGSLPYTNTAHTTMISDGCVTCHMAAAYGTQAGAHTWRMGYDYHEELVPNMAGCEGCHSGAEDFDINGAVTEINGLIADLKQILMDKDIIGEDGYAKVPITLSADEAGALYNYKYITEDRSGGVHNIKYAKALLQNSIEALQ